MSVTMTVILVVLFVAVLLLYFKKRNTRLTDEPDDE